MIRVKICGINSDAAFDTCIEAGADWIGFVFFPGSPRAVSPVQAARLSTRHAGGPRRVGLFVDPTDAEVDAALASVRLDVLQLNASAPRRAEIKARFGVPIWRAVGIAERADLPTEAGEADAVLLDAKPPPGATRPGGNAVAIDWSLLAGWRPRFEWLLAGGLTPENVATAIATSGAASVDVSSGVESSRGVKDPARIRAFIANARAATLP